MQQLDDGRQRPSRPGWPSRSPRSRRRRELLELGPCVARVQPGGPGGNRRSRVALLFRDRLSTSGPTTPDDRLGVFRGSDVTMKIVVIGGAGLIGARTVAILRQSGHEVVAASRRSGVNTVSGEGLREALAGAQV